MRRQVRPLLWTMTLPVTAMAAGAGTAGAQALDVPVSLVPVASAVRSAAEVADSLYGAMDALGAMEILRTRLRVAPDDSEAVWRAARVALTLGILTEDREAKLAWLRAASGYGERLLALDPDDAESLAWAAATKGRLAMEDHNPVTVARLGKEVWMLTEALLALDPDHPMGNALRGKLVQEVCRLSWGERMLARFLLGGDITGAARWSDSEAYLERAVKGDPGMVVYRLDLGDTYRLQGKAAEAAEVYRMGLALQERLPVDAYYKRRIRDGVRALSR